MAAVSQVQAAAQQLQEENRRIKARTNDQDERLKRLATQVKKEEELLAAKSKKAGVRPDEVPGIARQDAAVKKLQQQVREKEKQNMALARHITVYKHSFPQQQHKGPAARRPLSEAGQQQGGSPPRGAKKGTGSLMLGAEDDDQQMRLVLVLEGELERSREHLTQLHAELAVARSQSKDASDHASAKSSTESVQQLKKNLKEMSARLTILLNTQERTRAAFKEEEEQHSTLVNEVESLNRMLSEVRAATQQLSRDKQIMELRKDDSENLEKQIADTRKELAELDAENRALRNKAFNTGSHIVTAKETEMEQKNRAEEHVAFKEKLSGLQTKITTLQAAVDDAEKGDKGSVHSMQQTINTLDTEARRLQRETDRLREKLMSLSGQAHSGAPLLLAPSGMSAIAPVKRDQDKGKEVRRLRRENAQQVREIRKAEQELQLHKLLIKETEQLEQDLSRHIDVLSKAHMGKTAVLERKLSAIEVNNERLRHRLRDLEQGKHPSGESAAAVAAVGSGAGKGPAPAAVRSVVEICVEGLVLEKGHRALKGVEEPRTMLLLDFFLHDTQYSAPLVGLAPRGRLERSFETVVDHLLMHYLHTDALRIQLVRITGLDAEPLGEAQVALSKLVDPPASDSLVLHRVEVADVSGGAAGAGTGAAGSPVLAHVNVSVKFVTSIRDAVRAYQQHAPQKMPKAAEPESLLQLKEEMVRRVGATYTLRVTVSSVSGARGKLPVVVMLQLLDADVCASEVATTSADGAAAVTGARSVLQLEATQELDKRLLSQAMDVCLFDESDASSHNGLLGAGHVLLAPLLHRRGISGTVQLRSPEESGGIAASLTVDLAWDPEPQGGVAAFAAAAAPAAAAGRQAIVVEAAWEVRSTLFKIKVWAETLGMGQGAAAFKAVYEALLETGQQVGVSRPLLPALPHPKP
jgi:hypothetical protein